MGSFSCSSNRYPASKRRAVCRLFGRAGHRDSVPCFGRILQPESARNAQWERMRARAAVEGMMVSPPLSTLLSTSAKTAAPAAKASSPGSCGSHREISSIARPHGGYVWGYQRYALKQFAFESNAWGVQFHASPRSHPLPRSCPRLRRALNPPRTRLSVNATLTLAANLPRF